MRGNDCHTMIIILLLFVGRPLNENYEINLQDWFPVNINLPPSQESGQEVKGGLPLAIFGR